MEVITIDSKAFKELMEKLDALTEYVYTLKQQPTENDEDSWVDSRVVCDFLKISERTLQRLRSNGKITYSCMRGRYYYQISQIKRLLKEQLIPSTDECIQSLVKHHRQYESKRRLKK